MLRDMLANVETSIWSVVSLIIMFVAFIGVLWWTYSGKKNRFESESNLPLESDDEQITNSHSTGGLSS
jgi:cbb3-type cytochrome oxidase subunit 3